MSRATEKFEAARIALANLADELLNGDDPANVLEFVRFAAQHVAHADHLDTKARPSTRKVIA